MRTAGKLIVVIVFATGLAKAQTSREQASASSGQISKTVAERPGYPPSSRLLVIHADVFWHVAFSQPGHHRGFEQVDHVGKHSGSMPLVPRGSPRCTGTS